MNSQNLQQLYHCIVDWGDIDVLCFWCPISAKLAWTFSLNRVSNKDSLNKESESSSHFEANSVFSKLYSLTHCSKVKFNVFMESTKNFCNWQHLSLISVSKLLGTDIKDNSWKFNNSSSNIRDGVVDVTIRLQKLLIEMVQFEITSMFCDGIEIFSSLPSDDIWVVLWCNIGGNLFNWNFSSSKHSVLKSWSTDFRLSDKSLTESVKLA